MTTPAVIRAPQLFAKGSPKASVVKEIIMASGLGLCAGLVWKMNHWNERRKTEEYYAFQAAKSQK